MSDSVVYKGVKHVKTNAIVRLERNDLINIKCKNCKFFKSQEDMLFPIYENQTGLCTGTKDSHNEVGPNSFYSMGPLIVHEEFYCRAFKQKHE